MRVMDGLDAAMITGEVLTSPMHIAALLTFTPPPDAGGHYVDDLYRDALLGGYEIDPRLRQRPHAGVDTLGIWTWHDVEVDPADHMQRRVLPAGSGEPELWRLVADLHGLPLDRSRPQWMCYLIDGMSGGRLALYIKVHHTLFDGVAGMQLIIDALSTNPAQRSMKPFYAVGAHAPADEPSSAPTGLPNPVAALRSVIGTAKSSLGLTRELVSGGTDYLVAALKQESPLPLTAPFTRFNGRLGPERAVAGGTWPRQRIRKIQKAAGVTFNDVLTAMVSGALREWLIAHDELPGRSLMGFCPITVRVADERAQTGHNNMFGLEQCPLGTDRDDPAERLATIHQSMQWAKKQVARRGPGVTALLTVPNLAPSLLQSVLPLIPKWRTGYNVPISNIRGPEVDMYFNGAHLDSVYPISSVFDGLGLNVTMCSYASRVSFGYVAGRNLLPDIETLIPLTEAALAELESAFGVGGRRKR